MNELATSLAEAIDPSLQDRIVVCHEGEDGLECFCGDEPCEPDPNAVSIRLTWADADYGFDEEPA